MYNGSQFVTSSGIAMGSAVDQRQAMVQQHVRHPSQVCYIFKPCM